MTTTTNTRDRYETAAGIADWWAKDGTWHIALPYPDPCPETGLKTGGFMWTENSYNTREEAISAICDGKETR